MIEASGLVFSRRGTRVLDGVDLRVDAGECLGVVGPNGCGKTTLLNLLYRALTPEHGRVLLDGVPIEAIRRREIAARIAVVRQSEHADIALTVADTVLLGRLPHRSLVARPRAEDYDRCARALEVMGVGDLSERLMSHVSGGEARRVIIARALAQDADHVLLDEPTNHLDVRLQHEVLALVRTLRAAAVVVLHDLNLAARYCDRVLLLDRGRPVAYGTPEHVLTPEYLEPVYRVPVTTVRLSSGRIHLMLAEEHSVLTLGKDDDVPIHR